MPTARKFSSVQVSTPVGLSVAAIASFGVPKALCYHAQPAAKMRELHHKGPSTGQPVKVFTDWIEAFKEEVYTFLRGMYLTALFTPVLSLSPFCVWLGWGWHFWVDLLQWTLTMAGPAFIKWGQACFFIPFVWFGFRQELRLHTPRMQI